MFCSVIGYLTSSDIFDIENISSTLKGSLYFTAVPPPPPNTATHFQVPKRLFLGCYMGVWDSQSRHFLKNRGIGGLYLNTV